jgi:hypothetical protein
MRELQSAKFLCEGEVEGVNKPASIRHLVKRFGRCLGTKLTSVGATNFCVAPNRYLTRSGKILCCCEAPSGTWRDTSVKIIKTRTDLVYVSG